MGLVRTRLGGHGQNSIADGECKNFGHKYLACGHLKSVIHCLFCNVECAYSKFLVML